MEFLNNWSLLILLIWPLIATLLVVVTPSDKTKPDQMGDR